jgi:hypothetical protein
LAIAAKKRKSAMTKIITPYPESNSDEGETIEECIARCNAAIADAAANMADCQRKLTEAKEMLDSFQNEPMTPDNKKYLELAKDACRLSIIAYQSSIDAYNSDIDAMTETIRKSILATS